MSHLLSIRLQVCLRKLRRLLRSLMSFQAGKELEKRLDAAHHM